MAFSKNALNDPVSGLVMGDPDGYAALLTEPCPAEDIRAAASELILSASGWRMIFAASGDGEDAGEAITSACAVLAAAMAESFLRFAAERCTVPTGRLRIAVAMDSRPTGTAIADAVLRVLIHRRVDPAYLFIAAAPEVMAYAKLTPGIHGFIYISASHNPVGHNGVKFGFSTGGVIGGADSRELIDRFKVLLADPGLPELVAGIFAGADRAALAAVLRRAPEAKSRALAAYERFTRDVCADTGDSDAADRFIEDFAARIAERRIGIVAELNGSARTVSIDKRFLSGLGVEVLALNDEPRRIVHRIVPEGVSLDDCAHALEAAHRDDPCFILGYVPDNDGDRGNFVFFDEAAESVRTIEAQEIFALTVLAELSWLGYDGRPGGAGRPASGIETRIAVAVNCPTSMRIESIAAAFGARVHRAEVGEANVVNLASRLRDEGAVVRILGEGSNGGNITHPSAVRDPINTICSILKLLCIPELFAAYCSRAGLPVPEAPTLTDMLAALPRYTTTSAYEDRALLHIRTPDHGVLKSAYERIFLEEWPEYRDYLARELGVTQWEEINYEGIESTHGFGPAFRTGVQRGGFKILFKDPENRPRAFLWMRGSGTEPVFRILVDVEGDRADVEAALLDWHAGMVKRADEAAGAQSAKDMESDSDG